MSERLIIGIDLGTTGLKLIAARADDAAIVGLASAPVRNLTPAPGWLEQQPAEWWQALRQLTRQLLHENDIAPSAVAGIGLSGHMHSIAPLRADGSLAHNCLVWADARAQAQADQLAQAQDKLWNPAIAPYSLTKLLWLRENRPDVYAQTERVLFPKDYLRWRLTGELATDYSDASGSLMWDFRARAWDAALLADLGMSADYLPVARESCAAAGALTAQAAAELGLPPGVVVAHGGGDAACAVVGAGIPDQNTLMINAGTAVQVIQLVAQPTPFDARHAVRYLFELGIDGRCFVIGALNSAGHSLTWWRQLVAPGLSHAEFEALAAEKPGRAEGAIFLPYLQGTGTPFLADGAHGTFAQLAATADKRTLTRAVMDGVAMGIRLCAEAMLGAEGLAQKQILFTGGLPKSRLMRRILAGVFGKEARCLSFSDMSALGAAAHAAVAAGLAADAQSWLADFDYGESTQMADDGLAAQYEAMYERFKLWAARATQR